MLFSVGARFVFSGSMKPVNQLLGTFPRLIQKVCVLRIFDLRRRTGRVNYHGSAVAVIIAVIVIGIFFRIIELDHAYQLCSKPEMYEYLIRIAKQPKKYVLTDVMLETLSIIAYRQPITKLEIEKIRGVKSDHAVNKLIEYNLVCELGRLDAPGRPLLFGTTEEFLRRFSVQSLDDLPGIEPEKLETFKEEAEDEAQIRLNI